MTHYTNTNNPVDFPTLEMNKHIKELCVKSGAWDYYEVNEGVNGDELFMQKFAEVIVRECATRSAELGQPEIGKGLMKHFGVAE